MFRVESTYAIDSSRKKKFTQISQGNIYYHEIRISNLYIVDNDTSPYIALFQTYFRTVYYLLSSFENNHNLKQEKDISSSEIFG